MGGKPLIFMKINLLLDNHPYGPYDRKQVEGYLGQGRILESDLAWVPGLPDWIPLREVLSESANSSCLDTLDEEAQKIFELIQKGEGELALDLAISLNHPDLFGKLLENCCLGRDGSLHLSEPFEGFLGDLPLFFRLLANAPEGTPTCSTLKTENFKSLKFEARYSLEELSFLEGFPHLRELEFRNCSSLHDFKSLAKLPNLNSLHIHNCSGLKDLSSFENLSIQILYINDCTSLVDLSAVSSLPNLGSLDLKGCHSIREIDCVKALDLWNLVLPGQFLSTLSYWERVPKRLTKTFYLSEEFIDNSPFDSVEALKEAFDEGSDEFVEFSYEISGEYDELEEDWEDTLYDEWQFNARD